MRLVLEEILRPIGRRRVSIVPNKEEHTLGTAHVPRQLRDNAEYSTPPRTHVRIEKIAVMCLAGDAAEAEPESMEIDDLSSNQTVWCHGLQGAGDWDGQPTTDRIQVLRLLVEYRDPTRRLRQGKSSRRMRSFVFNRQDAVEQPHLGIGSRFVVDEVVLTCIEMDLGTLGLFANPDHIAT
jgi:hypothetical protein